jgi:hypothetical protein
MDALAEAGENSGLDTSKPYLHTFGAVDYLAQWIT